MNISRNVLISVAFLAAAPAAFSADFDDFARVVSVTPRSEQYNRPQQECRTEYAQVQTQQQRSAGGSILGGIAGAIIGNQVGGGSGRTVATAAGAIAGAVTGDRLDNRDNGTVTSTQPIQQCRMVDHWESRPAGFSVTYEYKGHNYTSILPSDPGSRLRVRVAITPIVDR
jgi:uncharacterized protein YcfJ